MKTSKKKIVIFEEINSGFLKLIDEYLNNGHIIYFFKLDGSLLKSSIIKDNLEAKEMIDLSKIIFDYSLFTKAARYTHKNLDSVFTKYFSNKPSIKVTSNLLKSTEIESMYIKKLLLYLQNIYEFELKINEITKENGGEIYFYPFGDFKIHSGEFSLLSKNIKVREHENFKLKIKKAYSKIKVGSYVFYPIYLFFRKTKWISIRKKEQKKFKLGINANLPSLFGYNYHLIDYVVDDAYDFPKSDILFIDETYEAGNTDGFEELGYSCMDFKRKKETMSLNLFFEKFVKMFVPAWMKCFVYSFIDEKFIVETTRVILTDFVRWNIFVDSYRVDNHVTILLPENISKNIILKQNSVKTWFIYPDNSSGDYHTGWDEKVQISMIFSFMNSDYAIVFGDKIVRYFNYHKNNIGNYITIGVLAAQTVRELREGKLTSKLPLIIKKKKLDQKCQKIIAVFDTSFVDYGPLKIKDGIRFGEDILRLLDEMPEIGVIFKEKKHLSVTPQLAPIYEKLENHERCVVVRKTDTDCIFSTEVIALSDLVISAAYTSTNAEALGAKTKAIYYDVAGTDIGDNYYFNKFPNFVAHNYDELKKLVKYWLYDVDDEKFEAFLNTYVKGEIDPYLDGKAIDRLQALLGN